MTQEQKDFIKELRDLMVKHKVSLLFNHYDMPEKGLSGNYMWINYDSHPGTETIPVKIDVIRLTPQSLTKLP